MVTAATEGSGAGLRRLLRYVAGCGVLAAALIVGLLTMHAPVPAGAGESPAITVAAHGPHASAPVEPSGAAGSCIGCGTDGHSGQAMACAMLLVLGLLVVRPRARMGRTGAPSRLRAGRWRVERTAVLRPPSLTVLGISRT